MMVALVMFWLLLLESTVTAATTSFSVSARLNQAQVFNNVFNDNNAVDLATGIFVTRGQQVEFSSSSTSTEWTTYDFDSNFRSGVQGRTLQAVNSFTSCPSHNFDGALVLRIQVAGTPTINCVDYVQIFAHNQTQFVTLTMNATGQLLLAAWDYHNVDNAGTAQVSITPLVSVSSSSSSTAPSFSSSSSSTGLGRVTGDPQFIGLLGQSFQVHGIDGHVYNLISSNNIQMNTRFAFLTGPRACPVLPSTGRTAQTCWSHDGSYLAQIGLMFRSSDHMITTIELHAGSWKEGVSRFLIDGDEFDMQTNHSLVTIISSHELTLQTDLFTAKIEVIDDFFNIVELIMHKILFNTHGLLGQTSRIHKHHNLPIQGDVDDYIVSDLFGVDFPYNQFEGQID